ncbi:hypothetical protein [Yoonia sediminilitoris]|uniref:Uncharacterized protein n=1 Tax=Yoonia sediminilitoris TaxID=1286148 RepID=A0A2T6KRI7_9RHOB|nr:hypothetical protein [Yoonia sediminilitoris]PUB19173.1 hypothetical protein C8N45_101766 [Yoonia sediminilitoris]RCW99341.1 hypothetical protein DFP92_101766 [Yoonia sediminilitoris]
MSIGIKNAPPLIAHLAQILAFFLFSSLSAQAEIIPPDTRECIPFQRSLILSNGASGTEEVLAGIAQSLDRTLSLQPDAYSMGADAQAACDAVIAQLKGPLSARPPLAETLSGVRVLAVVARGATPRIDVYAHVPALVDWAGDPFVSITAFVGDETSSRALPDALALSFERAAAFSAAMRAFLDGDRERAAALRPVPDQLGAVARAWAQAIPIGTETRGFLSTKEFPIFDTLPSISGENQIALFLAVARGTTSAEQAIRLSIPANDVRCNDGEATHRSELHWARFVSGFWRTIERTADRNLVPLADESWLETLPTVYGNGRTCFDAMIFSMLDRFAYGWDTDKAFATLRIIARERFARSDLGDTRAQLATEMMSATIAAASFQRIQTITQVSRNAIGRSGQCHQPLQREIPVTAAFTPFDVTTGSPLAPILALARQVRAAEQMPMDEDDLGQVMIVPAGKWLGASPDTLSLMLGEARGFSDAFAFKMLQHFGDDPGDDDVFQLLRQLRMLDNATFAKEMDQLRANLARLEIQSELALQMLLSEAINLFVSTPDAARNRVAYARLLELHPQLGDDTYLQTLFDASDETAIRVAVIDVLTLAFTGKPLPSQRNPWLEFAEDESSLPISAIPALGASDGLGVWITAASASLFALTENDQSDTLPDTLAVYGLVAADALYQAWINEGEDPKPFRLTPVTRRIHAALNTNDISKLFAPAGDLSKALEESDLEELAEISATIWTDYIRPYAELGVAAKWGDADAPALIDDVERLFLLARALQDPNHTGGIDVASEVLKRLEEDTGWPPQLRGLPARMALAALRAERSGQAALADDDRQAIRAEFEKLVPRDARQNLLDAGFIIVVLAALPVDVLLNASAHGGVAQMPEDIWRDILVNLVQEYDYHQLLKEGVFQEVTDILLALDAAPDIQQSEDVSDIMQVVSTLLDLDRLAQDQQPSSEAIALATMFTEGLNVDATLDAPLAERQAWSRDALGTIAEISATCPELASSLHPLRLTLTLLAGDPVDITSERDALRSLIEDGDNFKSVRVKVLVDLIGVRGTFLLSNSPMVWPLNGPTGELTIHFSATASGTKNLWNMSSNLGLVPNPARSSPAFAMALDLAHAADEAGDIVALDAILGMIETLAVGGRPYPASAQDPDPALPGIWTGEILRFGIKKGPQFPLWPHVSSVADPDLRLLRIAKVAEENGLIAMAWRLAGLALGTTLETPPGEEPDPDDPPEQVDPYYTMRQEIRDAFRAQDPNEGFHVARSLAAGRARLPARLAYAALCEKDETGCDAASFFVGGSPDIDEWPQPTTACETAARRTFTPALQGTADVRPCMHGLLRYDYEVHPNAPQMDVFAMAERIGQAGYSPLLLVRYPQNLQVLTEAVLRGAAPDKLSGMLGEVATVATSLGESDAAITMVYYSLFAAIANPETAELDELQRASAFQLKSITKDEKLATFFDRLANGAAIDADDRAYVAGFLEKIAP